MASAPALVLPTTQTSAGVGSYTDKCSDLVKLINSAVARVAGDDFRWTSIQINHNSVSELHADTNNDGLSALVLFGDFTDGYFVSEDAELCTNTPGQLYFFDGCEPHYSAEFVGTRFSVVLFCHSRANELPRAEKDRLEALGF